MINLVDVSLRYGEKVIYNKISTTIGVRDRIGLVGSNGAKLFVNLINIF